MTPQEIKTDAQLSEKPKHIGTRVVRIVAVCSDSFESPKLPWLKRKKEHLVRIGNASRIVRLVCASESLHDGRSTLADYREIGERLLQRFSGGTVGTLWYYREMAKAVRPLICVSRPLVAWKKRMWLR